MGENFQPVYFKVMGRGVPKIPLRQLPKFNLDVIPPPPWLPKKTPHPRGRGRGRIIYEYSMESTQSDSGSNHSSSSCVERLNRYASDQDPSSQNNEKTELILQAVDIEEVTDKTVNSEKFTEDADETAETIIGQLDTSHSLKVEDDQSTIIAESSTQEDPSIITDEKMNNLEKDLTETAEMEIFPQSSANETEIALLNIPISPTSSQSFHSIENPSLSPESDVKLSKSPISLRSQAEEEEEEEESDMEKHCEISPVISPLPQSSSPTSDEINFLDMAIEKKLNRFIKNNDASESVPNFSKNYYMSKKNASSRKQYKNVPKNNPQNYKKNRNGTSGGKITKNTRIETDSSDSNEKAERVKSSQYQQFAGYRDQRSPSPYHHLDARSQYCNPIPKPKLHDQNEFPSLDAVSSMEKKEQPKTYSSACKQTRLADLSSLLSPMTTAKSSSESLSSDSSASRFLEEYKVRETQALSNSSNLMKFVINNVTHERCEDNLREFLSQFGEVRMLKLVKKEKVLTACVLMEFAESDAYKNLCSTIDGICPTQFDPNHSVQDERDYGSLNLVQL